MCKTNGVTDDAKSKWDQRLVFTHAWWPVSDNCGASLNAYKLKTKRGPVRGEWNIRDIWAKRCRRISTFRELLELVEFQVSLDCHRSGNMKQYLEKIPLCYASFDTRYIFWSTELNKKVFVNITYMQLGWHIYWIGYYIEIGHVAVLWESLLGFDPCES